jgi:hypothetical protein
METPGGDPFADAAPGGPAVEDDPFAGVESDPAAEVAQEPVAAEGEPPVVDREGVPAEAAQEAPAAPAQPEAAPAQAEAPAAPAQAPVPPAEVDPERQPPAEPGGDAPGAQAAAAPAGDGSQPPAQDEVKKKGEMRHYKVLYQTADKQWAEHPLDQVPEGVNVVTLDGERWVEARNNDHMTRIAFTILGSPQDGVTVWPVPKGAYKPKRVKPAPPAPERTRLNIS